MSAASEQVSRCGDVLLPVCRRLGIGFMFSGGGCPGRGARYQPVVGWRGAWRGACQKFSQVVRVRDACSQVARMAGSEPGGQALAAISVLEVGGAEAQQDRLDDRCVIEERV
jgi:hypothetical protein